MFWTFELQMRKLGFRMLCWEILYRTNVSIREKHLWIAWKIYVFTGFLSIHLKYKIYFGTTLILFLKSLLLKNFKVTVSIAISMLYNILQQLSIHDLPAKRRNFWVSGGNFKIKELWEEYLVAVGLSNAPGEGGLGLGGTSKEMLDEDCSPPSFSFFFSSSFSEPCTRKKASTAGWRTSTAFVSLVSASSVNAFPITIAQSQ